MPQADVSEDVDLSSLFDEVLKCEGINYVEDDGLDWQDPCENPAEWTRMAHCRNPDFNLCTPCKNLLTDWARHGWVLCRDCRTVILPEELGWRRL